MDGDIIYTSCEIKNKGKSGKLQYFWKAFPVNVGREAGGVSDVKTTYMFTYFSLDGNWPSLLTLMEDYWDFLPKYQASISDPEKDLNIKRVLFAYFPTYADLPQQPVWSRFVAVGDSSFIQSPLSFDGFKGWTRNLDRISDAIVEALEGKNLDKVMRNITTILIFCFTIR